MAVKSFPPVVPESITFGLQHNVQVSVSPLNGITQTIELPGARWVSTITYTDLKDTEADSLKAWLLSLRGMSGRFFLYDYGKTTPTQGITGSPTIQTGSTARTLIIPTSGGDFSVGDYIQVGTDDNRELKMIVEVATGNVYTIEPAMRRVDYVGLNVVYNNCSTKFMLTTNEQSQWNTRTKAYLNDIKIDCVEAI